MDELQLLVWIGGRLALVTQNTMVVRKVERLHRRDHVHAELHGGAWLALWHVILDVAARIRRLGGCGVATDCLLKWPRGRWIQVFILCILKGELRLNLVWVLARGIGLFCEVHAVSTAPVAALVRLQATSCVALLQQLLGAVERQRLVAIDSAIGDV